MKKFFKTILATFAVICSISCSCSETTSANAAFDKTIEIDPSDVFGYNAKG